MAKRPQRRSGELTADVLPDLPLEVVAGPVSTYVDPGKAGMPAPPPGVSPPAQPDFQEAKDLAALGHAFGGLSKSLQAMGTVQVASDMGETERAYEDIIAGAELSRNLVEQGVILPAENPHVQRGREMGDAALLARQQDQYFSESRLEYLRETDGRWGTLEGGLSAFEAHVAGVYEDHKNNTPGGLSDAFDRAWARGYSKLRQRIGDSQSRAIGSADLEAVRRAARADVGDSINNALALNPLPEESGEDYKKRRIDAALAGITILYDSDESNASGLAAPIVPARMKELVVDQLILMAVGEETKTEFVMEVWNRLHWGPIPATDPETGEPVSTRPFLKDTDYAKEAMSRPSVISRIENNLRSAKNYGMTPAQSVNFAKDTVETYLQDQFLSGLITAVDPSIRRLPPDATTAKLEDVLAMVSDALPENFAIARNQGDDEFKILIEATNPELLGIPGSDRTFTIDVRELWDAARLEAIKQDVDAWPRIVGEYKSEAQKRIKMMMVDGQANDITPEMIAATQSEIPTEAQAIAAAELKYNQTLPSTLATVEASGASLSYYRDHIYGQVMAGMSEEDKDAMMTTGHEAFLDGYKIWRAYVGEDTVAANRLFRGEGGDATKQLYEAYHFFTERNPSTRRSDIQAYASILELNQRLELKEKTYFESFNKEFQDQWGNIEINNPEFMPHREWIAQRAFLFKTLSGNLGSTAMDTASAVEAALDSLRSHSSLVGGELVHHFDFGFKNMDRVRWAQHWMGRDAGEGGGVATDIIRYGAAEPEVYAAMDPGHISDAKMIWTMFPGSEGELWQLQMISKLDGIAFHLPGPSPNETWTELDFKAMYSRALERGYATRDLKDPYPYGKRYPSGSGPKGRDTQEVRYEVVRQLHNAGVPRPTIDNYMMAYPLIYDEMPRDNIPRP